MMLWWGDLLALLRCTPRQLSAIILVLKLQERSAFFGLESEKWRALQIVQDTPVW